jgi:hypothetical protein
MNEKNKTASARRGGRNGRPGPWRLPSGDANEAGVSVLHRAYPQHGVLEKCAKTSCDTRSYPAVPALHHEKLPRDKNEGRKSSQTQRPYSGRATWSGDEGDLRRTRQIVAEPNACTQAAGLRRGKPLHGATSIDKNRFVPFETGDGAEAALLTSLERCAVIWPVVREDGRLVVPLANVRRMELGSLAAWLPVVQACRVSCGECGACARLRCESVAAPMLPFRNALRRGERIRACRTRVPELAGKRAQTLWSRRRQTPRQTAHPPYSPRTLAGYHEAFQKNIPRGSRLREALSPRPWRNASNEMAQLPDRVWEAEPGNECETRKRHGWFDHRFAAIAHRILTSRALRVRWIPEETRWRAAGTAQALARVPFASLQQFLALSSIPKVSGRAAHQLPSQSSLRESDGIPCADSPHDSVAKARLTPATFPNTLPNKEAADGWRS